jgi:hypothetical protein
MDRGDGWYTPVVMESKPSEPMMEASPPAPTVDVSDADLLFQEVTQVAPGFNPKVFADALARFGRTRICNAISAIQEQVAKGNARNPAGALYAAIFRGFTANRSKPVERIPEPIEAWYQPGTTEVFVAPDEERSRWERETERREAEFRRSVEAVSAEEDVSQLLVEISIAIRESGMSRERVKELLEERYKARSQQYLNTEQLRDWLKFLCSSRFSIVPRSIDIESVVEQRN